MPTTQHLFDLSGRVAIVTGGGTHLGRAMATSLGELGASVVIASRRGELCEQVATEMRGTGIDCTGLRCDVTVEEEVNSLVDRVVADLGRLDVMVCNAGGRVGPTTYIPEGSVDEFTGTVELNIRGVYLCAQAAARVMTPQRSGSIITLGSIHGFLTSDKRFYDGMDFDRSGAGYQTAKGGIINLTRHLASELGEYGITVNCISPGQFPRPGTDPEFVRRVLRNIALPRPGNPDDLKGAVALLASPAGAWITGHNLVVDGGWSIW